jgi:hypothetical protein
MIAAPAVAEMPECDGFPPSGTADFGDRYVVVR